MFYTWVRGCRSCWSGKRQRDEITDIIEQWSVDADVTAGQDTGPEVELL